jgi:hypothetical protein
VQAGLPGDLVRLEVAADLGRGDSGAAVVGCEDIGRRLFLLVARVCEPETELRGRALLSRASARLGAFVAA